MADSKYILHVRKFLKNPLLARKQVVSALYLTLQSLDLIHPGMANVPKKDIKEKLASILKCKVDCLSIFGLKTKFGGGRSSGFALVYDSADARKKYDSKSHLQRVSIPPPACSGSQNLRLFAIAVTFCLSQV